MQQQQNCNEELNIKCAFSRDKMTKMRKKPESKLYTEIECFLL